MTIVGLVLSRVYTRQHVARQHVAFNMLLVAGNMLPVCCWIQRDTCCRDKGNMLPGNKQHVEGKFLLTSTTFSSIHCCLIKFIRTTIMTGSLLLKLQGRIFFAIINDNVQLQFHCKWFPNTAAIDLLYYFSCSKLRFVSFLLNGHSYRPISPFLPSPHPPDFFHGLGTAQPFILVFQLSPPIFYWVCV